MTIRSEGSDAMPFHNVYKPYMDSPLDNSFDSLILMPNSMIEFLLPVRLEGSSYIDPYTNNHYSSPTHSFRAGSLTISHYNLTDAIIGNCLLQQQSSSTLLTATAPVSQELTDTAITSAATSVVSAAVDSGLCLSSSSASLPDFIDRNGDSSVPRKGRQVTIDKDINDTKKEIFKKSTLKNQEKEKIGHNEQNGNTYSSNRSPQHQQQQAHQSMGSPRPRHSIVTLNNIECFRYNLVDREQRQEVVTKLPAICCVLGPESSRNYVLPALDRLCDFDNSTIHIAQALPEVFFASEGYEHSDLFVSLFYDLCSSDDTLVSAEAARSIKIILLHSLKTKHGASNLQRTIIPMFLDMATSAWSSHRCTAAALQPILAAVFQTPQERVHRREVFAQLCRDPDVTVRRAALSALHEWLDIIPAKEWPECPLAYVEYFLLERNHDTIRILLAQVIPLLAAKVGRALATMFLLTPTIALAKDESWRVRYILASELSAIYRGLSHHASALWPVIVCLAHDEEVQVRATTARQLGELATVAQLDTVENHLTEIVYLFARDEYADVRANVVSSAGKIAAVCSLETGRKLLSNVLVPLLNDTTAVQHVAIETISQLGALLDGKGSADILRTIIEQIDKASTSSNWRVRNAVSNQLHNFAQHLLLNGEHFELLMGIVYKLLDDDVSAVRNSTMENIPIIAKHLGHAWTVRQLTTLMKKLTGPDMKFYQRIQCCRILQEVLPQLAIQKKDKGENSTDSFIDNGLESRQIVNSDSKDDKTSEFIKCNNDNNENNPSSSTGANMQKTLLEETKLKDSAAKALENGRRRVSAKNSYNSSKNEEVGNAENASLSSSYTEAVEAASETELARDEFNKCFFSVVEKLRNDKVPVVRETLAGMINKLYGFNFTDIDDYIRKTKEALDAAE